MHDLLPIKTLNGIKDTRTAKGFEERRFKLSIEQLNSISTVMVALYELVRSLNRHIIDQIELPNDYLEYMETVRKANFDPPLI